MSGTHIPWNGEGVLREGAAERIVGLRLDRDWLGIDAASPNPVWWPAREIRVFAEGDAWRVERHGQSASPATLLVHDSELPALLHNWRPASAAETGAGSGAWQWLATAALLAAGLIVFTWKIALPWIGASLASTVPVEWETRLGTQMAAAMAPSAIRSNDRQSLGLLKRISGALEAHLEQGRRYSYNVALARAPEVNAFAAPGGSIVVYCGLVETMDSPELLAAVLAHEMQHVAHRHSTRALFRNFALRAVIAMLLGDPAGGFAQAAGQLGQLKYMREDEEEADREGLRLLARSGFDPGAMASMLRRLEAAGGSGPESLSWLDSHPAPARRIRLLEKIPLTAASAAAPAISSHEWEGLQHTCAATGPQPMIRPEL